MSGKICGHCTNWICDDQLHLKGHCIINRMDRFHGTMCDVCTKYQSMWEYTRPATMVELKEQLPDCKYLFPCGICTLFPDNKTCRLLVEVKYNDNRNT